MNIGFFGLGKLGLPTALAIESRGHRVIGYDPAPAVGESLSRRRIPYQEEGVDAALARTRIELALEDEVVSRCELLFIAIQTPHAPEHEGVTRMLECPCDFDYSFLRGGMTRIADAIERAGRVRIVVVVSTVLPGTIRREMLPLLGEHARLCYNPSFIAMGTVMRNFLSPEFVLLGADEKGAASEVAEFYRTIHDAPIHRTSIESAELIKVLYNTFLSTKIAFANTAMELCHKIPGATVDDVTAGLSLGTQRILSPRYLSGGMGDGGGCHPRDNIALRHLAQRLSLSFDWFDAVMRQRERHTEWLASLIERHAAGRGVCILGKAFKAGSNLTAGSPAILLRNVLVEHGHEVVMWDPHVDAGEAPPAGSSRCYFVGTRHAEFRSFPFIKGSVVLDPWRYILPQDGVEVIPIGIGPSVGTA
ncbi:MAG TPA: hypothetical protein DCZ01_08570 [Elusimicrobia bacterium]|nr:MAG: hypothetical protein A2X37_05040 [Elusimicrobia bacterium GWA2_66_18]OGR76918.1 MAG: hypothetical protein A2X40_03985 [Elusimicrobia bacterium GWC2_65_9]HAZ08556.1 hypothetical protein [Elusimicrobiota bacterium]